MRLALENSVEGAMMKARIGLLLILVVCVCSGCAGEKVQQEEVASSTCDVFAMDTYMTLTANGDNSDKALKEAVEGQGTGQESQDYKVNRTALKFSCAP